MLEAYPKNDTTLQTTNISGNATYTEAYGHLSLKMTHTNPRRPKQHLQIHHIKHWADGGATSVENAVCVCTAHHVLLHEGGYRIEQVADNEQRQHEQFVQQTVNAGDSAWEVEKRLRNIPESFDAVRQVSPERFRFLVVDSNGRDVVGTNRDTRVFSMPVDKTDTTYQASQSKIDSSVAEPAARYSALNSRLAVSFPGDRPSP